MTTDDPTGARFLRIERAMDSANDLIGELIRKLDDRGQPQLRVVTGGLGAAGPVGVERGPRLRIVHGAAEG